MQFEGDTAKIVNTYDGLRPTSETTWLGSTNLGTVTTNYDMNWMPNQKNVNFGAIANLTYNFDPDGMVTCATPSSAACGSSSATDYRATYTGPNLRISADSVRTALESDAYDTFGAIASRTMKIGRLGVLTITYSGGSAQRDSLGRLAQVTEVEGTPSSTTRDYGYSYDALGRLSGVTLNGAPSEAYTYDANGNRLTELDPSQGSAGPSAVYDAQDRLLTYTSLDGDGTQHNWSFAYANDGSLMSRLEPSTGAGTQTTYDPFGNLVEVDLLHDRVTYTVDGRGRRIAKTFDGNVVRRWLYDGQLRIIAEQQLDTTGTLLSVNRFVYGSRSNTPEAMLKYAPGATSPTAVYRIFSDHLGSPRYVVNVLNASDVLLAVHYTAFGIPIREAGSLFAIPFGFAGGLYDPDTGLVHFGARDYDPMIGRWISKDPILFGGQQANLYVYAGNDPVNFLDPTGLWIGGGVLSGSFEGGVGTIGSSGVQMSISPGGPPANDYISAGAFARNKDSSSGYPGSGAPCQSSSWAWGAYAGAGVGGWFSNARSRADMVGRFTNYSINLPWVSLNYAFGDRNILAFAVAFGPSVGVSFSKYDTWTIDAHDIDNTINGR